jgi:hypothetical protein
MLRDSKVDVIVQNLRLFDLQASKVRVPDKLVSRNHAIGSNRRHLAIMLDLINHNAQPIQFGNILILDKIVLASNIQNLKGFIAALEEYLFMLSREIIVDSLNLIRILISGQGKFGELEIFRAASKTQYLQKYFLTGKWVAPLKLTPCTM